METSTESIQRADRIFAKMIEKEADILAGAMMNGDYEKARKFIGTLSVTIDHLNRELEARTK